MNWSQATRKPTNREMRQFALLCGVFLLGLAAWQFADDRRLIALLCGILALVAAPLGVWKPAALRPVYVTWMVLVFPLGWAVSNLILAAVYLGVVVPIAIAFRCAGRDVLGLRHDPERVSYWKLKPSPGDASTYFRQF